MKFKKSALILGVSLSALIALPAFAQEQTTSEGTVTVLGSRIKRINKEGPAPVTVITSEAIKAGGYASVPDVLKSVTQNTGTTLSQQDYGGGIMTPGASQVNLRGLGPNHTLVMVNGHRVADFPMPYNGLSNFADTSNIPVSMVDSVEVLSGSASAIYGSDAVAGVVNFNLKKKADGTNVAYRYGDTEAGGGRSHLLSFSTGVSTDKFNLVFGAEYLDQKPIWQFDREIQDSTLDSPSYKRTRAQYVFNRYDYNEDVGIDPGTGTCEALSNLGFGTVSYQTDRFGDPYCGSHEAVAFGTITNQRNSLSTFTTMTYTMDDSTELYANIQLASTKTRNMPDVTYWSLQDAGGNSIPFYNSYSDIYETWDRIFMPEEAGGIKNYMTHNDSVNFTINPGFKKTIGDGWNIDASLNFSKYITKISNVQTVASKATSFYLGSLLGVEEDGTPIYSADPTKLFTALTPAQFWSISERSVTKAESQTSGASVVITKDDIFELPAGPVGFAAVGELDNQSYSVRPNTNATDFGYYYGYAATSGEGKRSHQAIGTEFKMPILKSVDFNLAGRYDAFQFGGNSIGKVTYNAGLEYRPINSLLLRAAYGTGFRAPDLHYIFAKLDLFHPTVTDYYMAQACGEEDCSKYEDYDTLKYREGSPDLKPETSKSFNAGFVFQPTRNFDISVDYFNVKMQNQVQDMSLDYILRTEASCRLGDLSASTPTCVDALTRVHRKSNGDLEYIYINPINVSREDTDGLDIQAHASFPTDFGKFKFSASHTEVFNHTSVQYAGDPEVDQLAVDSGYTIPKQKSNVSIGYEKGPFSITFTGNRIGKMQNYAEDGWVDAQWIYNANATYSFGENTKVSFTVDNLTDEGPVKDDTWASYPYYNSKWYDSIGRSYYLEISHKF